MTQLSPDEASPPVEEPPRGTGKVASLVPLAVMAVLAALFAWQIKGMKVGSLTEPGPGLWPLVLVIALFALCVAGCFVDLRDGIEAFDRGSLRVLAGFGAISVFVLVFQAVGVIGAGFVFMMLWLRLLHHESWRVSIVLSIVTPLVCYGLFVDLLGVRFPADLVAGLWGGR